MENDFQAQSCCWQMSGVHGYFTEFPLSLLPDRQGLLSLLEDDIPSLPSSPLHCFARKYDSNFPCFSLLAYPSSFGQRKPSVFKELL